ncbi:MAG: hypothetical protein AAGC85_26580, partial [Bacteroidota bacterium]
IFFYASSKHFPYLKWNPLTDKRMISDLLGIVFSLISLYLFIQTYGAATGTITWIIALTTILSGIILSIKLKPNSIWLWVASSFIVTMLSLFYAG